MPYLFIRGVKFAGLGVCYVGDTESGYSHRYKVAGIKLSGSELGMAVRNMFKYNSFDYYVVIFWDKGEATILKMNSSFDPGLFDSEVTDQYDRKWKIRKQDLFCQ